MITPLMLFLMALFGLFSEEDDRPINSLSDPIPLIDYCRIIETPEKLTAEEVSTLLKNKHTPLAPQSDTQGFSQNYFWISFDLKNFQTKEALIIELDNPHLDHVYFISVNQNGNSLVLEVIMDAPLTTEVF